MILADLEVRGKMRQVLMQAPKNGFFYVIDRATGELLAADKYVPVTWASHVDLETGRPVETANADHLGQAQNTAPASIGGHNWQPMAYNHEAGLVYIPAQEGAQEYSTPARYEHVGAPHFNLGQAEGAMKVSGLNGLPETLIQGVFRHMMRGKLIAWDPLTQSERWHVRHESPWNGGVLTTASGLVFQGNGDNKLVAYDALNGEVLWQSDTGTGVVAPPITFELDGVQYLAVLAGWGGIGGLMTPRFEMPTGGNRLLVYRLGGETVLPKMAALPTMTSPPPEFSGSDESVSRGEGIFQEYCARCHGTNVGVSNVVRDLRYMSDGTHQIFDRIVLEGLYSGLGMVSFADHLSPEEVEDIHQYLIKAANDTWIERNSSGWWHEFKQDFFYWLGDFAGELVGSPES